MKERGPQYTSGGLKGPNYGSTRPKFGKLESKTGKLQPKSGNPKPQFGQSNPTPVSWGSIDGIRRTPTDSPLSDAFSELIKKSLKPQVEKSKTWEEYTKEEKD